MLSQKSSLSPSLQCDVRYRWLGQSRKAETVSTWYFHAVCLAVFDETLVLLRYNWLAQANETSR